MILTYCILGHSVVVCGSKINNTDSCDCPGRHRPSEAALHLLESNFCKFSKVLVSLRSENDTKKVNKVVVSLYLERRIKKKLNFVSELQLPYLG